MNARKPPPGLWKLVLYVAAAHVVAVLVLSPQFYCSSANSPEALFARGEQAMSEGKHVEAMQYFRQVMDQQPKPPPIYARAAEQHRIADRLARQDAGKRAQEAEQKAAASPSTDAQVPASEGTSNTPSTQPATRPRATEPDAPFIPPELRR
jgi:thioredoxin-like negative regulator of GroEL